MIAGGKNHTVSEETRKKMSIAKKGKMPWNFGKHLSETTKAKLSIIGKGRPSNRKGKPLKPHSAESRAKRSKSMLGNKRSLGSKRSEEQRAKMSETVRKWQKLKHELGEIWGMAGKSHSPETRAKMSESGKGRVYSPEARLKMSESQKKRQKREHGEDENDS